MSEGRGFGGNREVSPFFLLSPRGDLSGAGSEPKASDAHVTFSSTRVRAKPIVEMVATMKKITIATALARP
jgi:hypothetical protein